MPPVNQLLAPGVSFLSLPDTRFKTAQLTAALLLPLTEETAAENAIVPYLLRRCCAAYPDMTALNRRLNELYGARVYASVARLGDLRALVINAGSIDDRFALQGEAVVEECASLLLSMLFEPALEGGLFREQDVEQERRCLIEQIEAEINEKRLYARHRCEQLLCPGAYSVPLYGTAERARALTRESVTAAWKRILSTAKIQWFYQGSGDGAAAAEAVRRRFQALGDRRPAALATETRFAEPDGLARQTEEMAVNQSKLVMGLRVGVAEPDGDVNAARLMNALFGGTPHSLLFRNVREKLSLCYYCSSSYDRLKGVMLVDSGVEADQAGQAEAEILRQLELLQRGEFSGEDLESARKAVLNQFLSVGDLQSTQAAWYLGQCAGESFVTPEEAAEQIAAVTKEEVCRTAQTVRPACVYRLQAAEGGERDANL